MPIRSALVVDDSVTVRLVMDKMLQRVSPGARIQHASTAPEAMRLFLEQRPDVVFLDMMLNRGSGGLSLLRSMLDARPDVRIVLVTGLPAVHQDVVQAISLGAVGHLLKPIRFESVRDVLARIEQETESAGGAP